MPFTFLATLGVRVIEVENLGRRGMFVPAANIVLMDRGLDETERAEVLSAAIGRAWATYKSYDSASGSTAASSGVEVKSAGGGTGS